MRKSKSHLLSLLICLLTAIYPMTGQANIAKDSAAVHAKLTTDGPYILYQADGSARVVTVTPKGKIKDVTHKSLPARYGFDVVSHDRKYRFHVTLHDSIYRPDWKYTQPRKLFVMSDPHGNLGCVISLLQANGVIDKKYHWAFGANRMVVIGDIFDRGHDAIQIFWLVYQLQKEARMAGGDVDFLLGNHEPMVLMNDLRYTKDKYKALATKLGMKYPELLGPDTELGRWLCTRNTMQVVGRNLFVHAGLSAKFLNRNLDIPTVNEQVSRGLYKKKAERKAVSPLVYFLHGSYGPLWYRGMVRTDTKYHPLTTDTLQLILNRYEADRAIVGHTIFKDISKFYKGQVIGVNVDNAKNKKARRGRAILIEDDKIYVVGDKGKIRRLLP